MKKYVILLSASLLIVGCSNLKEQTASKTDKVKKTVEEKVVKKIVKPQYEKKVIDGRTYINGILIVNKQIGLPKDYNPGEDPAAHQAIQELMQAGNRTGLQFVLRSSFRSYDNQAMLYQNYVAKDGKAAADTYSAEPGHSEHQTGLAYDVGSVVSANDFRVSFGTTPEGEWLKHHAHEFGFIIRYGEGKTHITGYQYEPWHVRYVGKKVANEIYKSNKTLEEYLGLYPKDLTETVK